MDSTLRNGQHGERTRVLAVADWSIDPKAVIDALRVAGEGAPTTFGLLVPSRLPGLDWVGDPHASRPCARRQLDELERLAMQNGLAVGHAKVGDPERVSAVCQLLGDWAADRVVLFDRSRILPAHPLSVTRRIARATDRPVERIAIADRPSGRSIVRRAPRCSPLAQAA
jgi:hypothetical protein